MHRSHCLSFFVLFAVAALGAGCAPAGQAEGGGSQAPPGGRGGTATAAVPVSVGRVIRKAMPLTLRVIGTVEPSSTVAVHAQITGQLTTVAFQEGDEVKQGDVLFALDRRPLEATLQQAEANLQRDTAQDANAKVQAQRFIDLAGRGIATREQVETSRANAEALDGTIGADRAAVDNAKIQLQYATITAPISGRTGALMVHEGNLVRANDTAPLVVINQLSPINVAFAVPEAELPELKRYMAKGEVTVAVQPPDEAATPSIGKLTFVDNAVDETTGTIRVKGSFANADHSLWPGQYVGVTLTLTTDRDDIVVPTAAIQSGQTGNYVYVVKANHVVELHAVKVRRPSGNETIVDDGVAPEDVVVTDGQLRLVPGSLVNIKESVQKAGP